MVNQVTALATKKQLTLIPDVAEGTDGSDREFDVTVINNSNKFASFQLELIAPGLDPQAEIDWYRVEPEICAKKPPGDRTDFHVTLLKPPIPAYDTTIELTLRAFSVEFANLFSSQTLQLKIEKPRRSLKVYLPTQVIKVFPGDTAEIPVLVNNLSSKSTEISLRLNLEPSWFPQGVAQSLRLEPGDSQTVSFWCQPPTKTALSQSYDFKVEAQSTTSNNVARDHGSLEVLPQGVVEFSCEAPRQTIPTRKGRFGRTNTAAYDLKFVNSSNLAQQVMLQLLEADQRRCGLGNPDRVILAAGELRSIDLTANKQRPWLGGKRRFTFDVVPLVSDPVTEEPGQSVRVHPSDLTLELHVLPRIPLWLQLGGALLTLLMVWLAISFPKTGHRSSVNFVRFSGDGTTVLSGSSDQTLLRWQTNNTRFQPESLQFSYLRQLSTPVGVGEKIGKAVRILRHRPEDNDVAAIGLEDGTIQLWNLSRIEPLGSPIYSGTDRVFDLVFTQDSKTLFSAHGSGNVYARRLGAKTPPGKTARRVVGNPEFAELVPQQNRVRFLFSISALALSENQQPSLVVVGGQFNQLALWDWQNQQVYQVPYVQQAGAFSHVQGKQQFINSLAVAGNLLAVADSEGLITLWNINSLRRCRIALPDAKKPRVSAFNSNQCGNALIQAWRPGRDGQPIRAVALSKDACYLASAGDDGEVVLVPLLNGQPQENRRKSLGRFQQGVQSVDISVQGNEILVTSDAEGDRVLLYRINKEGAYANCQ